MRLDEFKKKLDMNTVTELPAVMRGRHMLREINEGLMIRWINEDRLNRSHLDVRKSVVLYDETGMFEYAMPDLPDDELLQKLFDQTTIRYWSRGIA